jgi:hypothetical protein
MVSGMTVCLHNDDRALSGQVVDTTAISAFVMGIVSVDSNYSSISRYSSKVFINV